MLLATPARRRKVEPPAAPHPHAREVCCSGLFSGGAGARARERYGEEAAPLVEAFACGARAGSGGEGGVFAECSGEGGRGPFTLEPAAGAGAQGGEAQLPPNHTAAAAGGRLSGARGQKG